MQTPIKPINGLMVMARFRRLSNERKIYEGLRKLRCLLVRYAVYLRPFSKVRRVDRICITQQGVQGRFIGQNPNDTLQDLDPANF